RTYWLSCGRWGARSYGGGLVGSSLVVYPKRPSGRRSARWMSSLPSDPLSFDVASDSGARYPRFVTSSVQTCSRAASVVATQSGTPAAGATSSSGGASLEIVTQG